MTEFSTPSVQGTALITGASSGIGYEIALLLARQGYDLVLVSRDRSALEALAAHCIESHGVRAEICAKDLSLASSAGELFAELEQRNITIDSLINDAGFAMQGPFVENDPANLLNMLQVNIVALTQLTRLFLPGMVHRGRGRILNMASIGAFMPGPMMAAYFASKAFVLSLSQALANELQDTGVTVTAVCAGPTRTKFAHRARLMGTKAFSGSLMDPADLARESVEAMMKGRQVLIAPFKYRLQLLPTPLLPRRLLAHFARQYHETRAVPKGHAAGASVWASAPDDQPATPIVHS
ncbi:MAG TPA: SDR family oxidoreductase [Tepidisphaeraceae bacterium]|nr:SDR family oxidoreductase [Tepidisphaeraceae bacterium]